MPQPIECFLTLINITVDCPSKLVVTDASQIEYSGTKPALIKSTLPTRPCPFVTTSLEGRCFGWGYRSFPVIAGFWHLVANMVYSSLLCPNETRYSSFVESCWWHVALKHFCLAVISHCSPVENHYSTHWILSPILTFHENCNTRTVPQFTTDLCYIKSATEWATHILTRPQLKSVVLLLLHPPSMASSQAQDKACMETLRPSMFPYQ